MADKDLYAEVLSLTAVVEKMLEVQEKQEQTLKTIAACLEKISGAYGTDWAGNGILKAHVVNHADFPH